MREDMEQLTYRSFRRRGERGGMGRGGLLSEQFLRREAQAVYDGEDPWPFVGQKTLALAGQEKCTRALAHVHPATAALLHQAFVHQLLIALSTVSGFSR